MILANFLWLSIDNSNSEQVTYPSYYIQKSLANICYWIKFSCPAFAFQENSYLYTHSWFSTLGARRAHEGKFVFCFRWSRHRLLWCTIAWHCFACCRRGNIFQAHHLSPQELKKKEYLLFLQLWLRVAYKFDLCLQDLFYFFDIVNLHLLLD